MANNTIYEIIKSFSRDRVTMCTATVVNRPKTVKVTRKDDEEMCGYGTTARNEDIDRSRAAAKRRFISKYETKIIEMQEEIRVLTGLVEMAAALPDGPRETLV